jgi:Predicted hydrolases or acyltransferases (alpha/beta hydrolase superfamily)
MSADGAAPASAPAALSFVEAGRGEGLILLHGLGASHLDWEAQLPAFSASRRVVAPDLRGYGDSPHAGDYRVPTFAADVWALADRLGLQRFDLVGHSMGGAVALQMAVDAPQRIRRLVLADTLPSFVADSLAKRWMFWYRLLAVRLLGQERLARAVAERTFPDPGQEALRERMAQRGARTDSRVYLDTVRNLRGWTVVDRLDRLTLPVLVLAAEHDYFPRREAERFVENLPDGRLLQVAGAHHQLPVEVPELFNRAVLEFLEADPPAG